MADVIDFSALADALLQRIHVLLPQWLPAGEERNERWYVGDFDGSPGSSANVNMRTGQWIDNAAPQEEVGNDLISLYARIHGINNGQAARQLMETYGWDKTHVRSSSTSQTSAQRSQATSAPAGDVDQAPAQAQTSAKPKRAPSWKTVVPVPKHAPAPVFKWGFKDEKQGGKWVEHEFVRSWAYEFEGQLYGHVARFHRVDSKGELAKETIPFTWCENQERNRGTQEWHKKTWDEPRPLYVPATLLSADLSLPVVVVEGEKCAEAGHQLLGHEFDFVSWPGGCKAWAMASWGWLMGRSVILWPDCDAQRKRLSKAERDAGIDPKTKPFLEAHDQPGMAAMAKIGTKLQADYGCTVAMCNIPAPGAVGDGWDIADAITQGWDAETVRAFIRGAVAFESPNDEARAKTRDVEASAGASGDDTMGWRGKLITASNGSIKPVRENVVLAVDGMRLVSGKWLPGIPEAAGIIAFNEFTNDVMKLKATPWGTQAGVWDEVDELELGDWLAREHWLPPMSRQTLEEAVKMIAFRHRFHPARERITALRGKWDEQKRLDTWVARCCRKEGVTDAGDPLQKYLARVGTWLIMAIVARLMTPGCKFDYMLILEGGQGMGKSTLSRKLALGWFADTGLVLGDKDSYQNLQGVAVYEWGELDSLTRAEVTKVKQFVSSQWDRFRASFDRRPKDYPRQVVFIGTTNESHYLSDPTGNRRFWPVRVTRFIDLEWIDANLEQMFAEALVYFEAGNRFHPTQAEQSQLFDPQQLERTVENALESAIRRYLYDEDQHAGMHGKNGTLINEITLADLLTSFGISVDKQTPVLTKQASAALGRLGWERGRASGKGGSARPWVYRRPPNGPEHETRAPAPAVAGGARPINSSTQSYATTDGDDAMPF